MAQSLLLTALLLTACGPSPQTAARPGPTLVSLNPCSDAVLAEVAGPGQLLAISHYSHDPASTSMDLARARRYRTVSGSVEEVLALRPDVVVSGNFLPPATVAALRESGVRLVELPIATSVAGSKAQVAALAALAGHPERGHALNARIDAALAQAAPPAGVAAISALVWQSGGIVPGRDTLIADMLNRTGFALSSAARGLRQADVLPLEEVLADPPRVILAAGDPRSGEDRMLGHPALAGLAGTRRAAFEPSLLWCGGPTIVRAADRLREIRATVEGSKPARDGSTMR